MRLHTDFHDYYDNAVGYGIDENVYYSRFTEEVNKVLNSKSIFPRHLQSGKPFLIGFCGKVFPMIEVKIYDKFFYDGSERKVIYQNFAYSFEELVEQLVEGNLKPQKIWSYWRKKPTPNEIRKDIGKDLVKDKVKDFFFEWGKQDDSLFLEFKVPCWLIDSHYYYYDQRMTLNPKLKDYEFDRIKDSFTAFQEISMYLSNILVEQKEIAVIEDKYRIEQHGFDLKKSFRKEKGK